MVFKSKDNKYISSIRSVQSVTDSCVKLDSGTRVTALRVSTIAFLVGWKKCDLVNYLRNRDTVDFHGTGDYIAKLVPCKLNNIVICGEVIKSFYCVTSTDNMLFRDALGADFIGACKGKINYEKDMELYDLDDVLYKRRFMSQCQGAYVTDVRAIDSFTSMDLVTKVVSGAICSSACEAWRSRNDYDINTYEKELHFVVDMFHIRDVKILEEIVRLL